MADGQAIQSVLVGSPFGHELVHEGNEAGVVGRFEKVHEFVDDEVFEALGGLFGEVGVETDGAGVVIATAPLGFHLLDEDPFHLYAYA